MNPTLYWSVRRELWENRAIYIAPVCVALLVLFGFMVSTFTLPRRMHAALALSPVKQHEIVMMPYNFAAGMVLVTAFIVGVFYSLDALYGERRDRSILFWKSLPVSDRTTVLAKASIPLVILPLIVFGVVIATQVIILILNNASLARSRTGLALLWTHLRFFQSSIALLYSLIALALWHAPLYAWLLLISAWAKRAAFLWAVLPLFAIGIFEHIAFQTKLFFQFLGYRVVGWFEQAFLVNKKSHVVIEPLDAMTPGRFLATPGLWVGLVAAAMFLAAAVRLRRSREAL